MPRLYDGASALAEAMLMAVRLMTKKHKASILMPQTVHPYYRQAVAAIVGPQDIKFIDVPYVAETGKTDFAALKKLIWMMSPH